MPSVEPLQHCGSTLGTSLGDEALSGTVEAMA